MYVVCVCREIKMYRNEHPIHFYLYRTSSKVKTKKKDKIRINIMRSSNIFPILVASSVCVSGCIEDQSH